MIAFVGGMEYFAYLCKNIKVMQVLLNIPDVKAPFLMDVLQHISYVKIKPLTDEKALLLTETREAVEEMRQIKSGKKQARNMEDFLNEL
jgi:hypothetical protein